MGIPYRKVGMLKKMFADFQSGVKRLLFQGTFIPLATVPGNSKLGELYKMQGTDLSLSFFVNGFFTFAIALGAIAAVLRIAYAGYLYMGSDMWGNKAKAKEILTDVVIGLLLLLSIWIILNQINPDILKLDVLKTLQTSQQEIERERERQRERQQQLETQM